MKEIIEELRRRHRRCLRDADECFDEGYLRTARAYRARADGLMDAIKLLEEVEYGGKNEDGKRNVQVLRAGKDGEGPGGYGSAGGGAGSGGDR